jgi:hypothetical protein
LISLDSRSDRLKLNKFYLRPFVLYLIYLDFVPAGRCVPTLPLFYLLEPRLKAILSLFVQV